MRRALWSFRPTRAVSAVAIAVGMWIVLGFAVQSAGASGAHLEPAPVGSGQCQALRFKDHSVYAQIAVDNTTCSVLAEVAAGSDEARGSAYHSSGFACTSTTEGAHSKWASAWGGIYYAYSCENRTRQVAFTWGTDYTYGKSSSTTSGGTSTGVNSLVNGHLEPAPVGSGQCQALQFKDHSVYAQIAVDNTTCSVLAEVAAGSDEARGSAYHSSGFACTSTTEGAHSKWASAWGGTYYAYSCENRTRQVAFTWGTDYTY